MVLVIEVLGVVIPGKLHHIGALLRILVAHVVGAYRRGGIPLGVVLLNVVIQPSGDIQSVGIDGVVYLVAYTPHYHTGVISVALYPAADIALGMLHEKAVVVHLRLGLLPHVEGFAVHQQSHFIAQLNQLPRRHIVGGADSVDAHFLHYPQLTGKRGGVHRGSQCAQVVVHTYAVHFHFPAVDQESSVRAEFRRAVAEILAHAVQELLAAV